MHILCNFIFYLYIWMYNICYSFKCHKMSMLPLISVKSVNITQWLQVCLLRSVNKDWGWNVFGWYQVHPIMYTLSTWKSGIKLRPWSPSCMMKDQVWTSIVTVQFIYVVVITNYVDNFTITWFYCLCLLYFVEV